MNSRIFSEPHLGGASFISAQEVEIALRTAVCSSLPLHVPGAVLREEASKVCRCQSGSFPVWTSQHQRDHHRQRLNSRLGSGV